MPPNATKVKEYQDNIAQFTKLCKELKSAGDSQVCDKDMRKKTASGQHGLKDNATNKQVREGLEQRIDQIKRDLAKEQAKT
ncbi:MAG TPA: hypothetical protein VH351_22510 [Bryobacteraceae bacterium]|jgi:hypothetical protein|nr:hypothetical protein [Bryobacteraceae bacterium]